MDEHLARHTAINVAVGNLITLGVVISQPAKRTHILEALEETSVEVAEPPPTSSRGTLRLMKELPIRLRPANNPSHTLAPDQPSVFHPDHRVLTL